MGLSTDPYLEAGASASKTEGWTCRRQQVPRWEDWEDGAGLAHAGGRAGQPQGAPWEPRRLQEPKVLAQDGSVQKVSIKSVVKTVGRQAADHREWPWVLCAILGGAEAGVCAQELPAGK